MKPGPRPLPTEVARHRPGVKKNPKRLAARNDSPTGLDPLPMEPPDHIKGPQADAWRYIRGHIPEGVAFKSDALALEMISRLWAQFQAGGLDSQMTKFLDSMLGKFGLNPADRARVHQAQTPRRNKFDQ